MFSNVFSRIRMLTLLCVYFLKIKTQFGKSEARTLITVFDRFQEAWKRLVRSTEEKTLGDSQTLVEGLKRLWTKAGKWKIWLNFLNPFPLDIKSGMPEFSHFHEKYERTLNEALEAWRSGHHISLRDSRPAFESWQGCKVFRENIAMLLCVFLT
jgi:hypothetical protein